MPYIYELGCGRIYSEFIVPESGILLIMYPFLMLIMTRFFLCISHQHKRGTAPWSDHCYYQHHIGLFDCSTDVIFSKIHTNSVRPGPWQFTMENK